MRSQTKTLRYVRGAVPALLAALLLATLLLSGGCSNAEADRQAAEQQRLAAEQQQQREAEEARLAEQARIAEMMRQEKEMAELFGAVGSPPGTPPAAGTAAEPGSAEADSQPAAGAAAEPGTAEADSQPAAGTAAAEPGKQPEPPAAVGGAMPPGQPEVASIPFDEAVPALPPDPTVRVAVLSHAAPLEQGRQVAILIGTHERERLEEQLGMAVRVLYVAESSQPLGRASEIHYRPEFLRAAVSIATVMTAEQWLGPMSEYETAQPGVDLVVHIGADYR